MTMTVGARSLDNEERSNFRDYMSLLSLSVDASMTVREIAVLGLSCVGLLWPVIVVVLHVVRLALSNGARLLSGVIGR